MKTILLVEDDEFFRVAIKDTLKKHGYNATEAPDGKAAKSILSLTSFDLVISDIQMPHFNGLEVLEWIKQKKTIPVILMTGFSNILETQTAASLGAAGFLAKPFHENDLIATIQAVLEGKQSGISTEPEEVYCRILLSDFVMGSQIPFNVFIRIGTDKYVKIAYKGENIPPEKIKMYMQRNVRYLYIRLEDYTSLVGMNLKLAKSLSSNRKISSETKKNFIKYTGELILEKTFVGGLNNETFQVAKEFVESSLSVILQDDDAFTLLNVLNRHSDFLYAHSLGVSMYAVLIAKQLGWTSQQTIFKLNLAGLFHDVGKKEIDRSLLEKPRATLTQQERKVFETHTVRGQEILQTIQSMPNDVVQIALEHHENILGMGYPRGVRKEKIHPLARLINVADVFCNYAIKNPGCEGMSGKEALERMNANDRQTLDSEYFIALSSLFK